MNAILKNAIVKIFICSFVFVLFCAKPFYAVYLWVEDDKGIKCILDDGTYRNTWKWLDIHGDGLAYCFYFDQDGYLMTNAYTPDGNQVNESGIWVVNGVEQRKAFTEAEMKPYTEVAFRQYLNKELIDFMAKCNNKILEYSKKISDDLDNNSYENSGADYNLNELRQKLEGYHNTEFKLRMERICEYYHFSPSIAYDYIEKAEDMICDKMNTVWERFEKRKYRNYD